MPDALSLFYLDWLDPAQQERGGMKQVWLGNVGEHVSGKWYR